MTKKEAQGFWSKVIGAVPRPKSGPWQNFGNKVAEASGEAVGNVAGQIFFEAVDLTAEALKRPPPDPNPFANAPQDTDLLIQETHRIAKKYLDEFPSEEQFLADLFDRFVLYCQAKKEDLPAPELMIYFREIFAQINLGVVVLILPNRRA